MNKVLIITYYWPPGSGAGVQRWLKFSKYLPSLGWEPVILTVDPEYAAYPQIDHSLKNDIPAGLQIYKTAATDYFRIYKGDRTKVPSAGFAAGDENSLAAKTIRFIRGNFFIPDPRKGWNIFAFRKACEIINNEGIKHIITTSPPHSTQLIGLKLKKKFPQIKWIADIRDPWTDIYYYTRFYHTFIARKIDETFEKKVLKTADQIVTVGKSLKDIFVSKLPGIKNKIKVIMNGYDEEDFLGLVPVTPGKFTISYTGTLSDAYPVEGLIDALRKFRETGNDFLLRFVGSVSSRLKELILSKSGDISIDFIPYVNHGEAIKYMMESSVLLLIIPDHHSNKCIITGKLFEYMAAGKPILCLGPDDGDAAEIIRNSGSGEIILYNESDSIEHFLEELIKGRWLYKNPSVHDYSRNEITRQLVNIIKDS